MIVTREEKRKYEREGYLVIDPGISEQVCDQIIAVLEDAYQGAGWIHSYFEGCRYYPLLFSDGKNIHWRHPELIA